MSLHGDGINDELYFLLWAKDDLNYGPSINVPDTVVYKFGQPVAWYFTAQDGKVRRKNKQNLINVRIEEAFTKYMMAGDIVAYYISLPTGFDDSTSAAGQGVDTQTRIEYLDRNGLHDFLYNRWKESNGVLQRFVEPKGTHNSVIRAIWSPKVCLLERRSNVRHIFDKRFGLYERAVTYEGQDYHSSVLPLRGNILASRLQRVCEEVVEHVAQVTFQKQCIARIVLNFKVDARDQLYLLWSSSIRLSDSALTGRQPSSSSSHASDKRQLVRRNCLNIDAQLKLPPHITLTHQASHSTQVPAPVQHLDCLSCGHKAPVQCFHPLPYKTIIQHYDALIGLLTAVPGEGEGGSRGVVEWPPDPRVIEAAGGVGFGCLDNKQEGEEEGEEGEEKGEEGKTGAERRKGRKGGAVGGQRPRHRPPLRVEEVAIPPMIRHMHPKLKLPAYRRYKKDPLFLYKNVSVCEGCYLVFAELALQCSSQSHPSLYMVLHNPQLAALFHQHRRTTAPPHTRSRRRSAPVPDDPHSPCVHRERSLQCSSATGPYRPPTLGRPAIHAPPLPHAIHSASEAKAEYGAMHHNDKDNDHDDTTNQDPHLHTPAAGLDPQSVVKSREDAFFRDAYKSPSLLGSQHPLLHLISTYAKLQDVTHIHLRGDNELGHVRGKGEGSSSNSRRAGMTFAGYGDTLRWKKATHSKHNNKKGRGDTAASGASADGKVSVMSSGSQVKRAATLASAKHKDFLLKTLAQVQQQLSSPGAMTRSILQSLNGPTGLPLPLPSNTPLPAIQQTPAATSVPGSAASSVSGASAHAPTTSHTAHKHSPAPPKHTEDEEEEEEEEEEGEDALPWVVFQDEVTVDVEGSGKGVSLSVTVYEEEGEGEGEGGGHTHTPTPTQLLFSCVAVEEVGWEPGHWKLLVTEGHMGMQPGALRGMRRGDKRRLAGRVAAQGLRMGGSKGAHFLYLEAAATAQAAAAH